MTYNPTQDEKLTAYALGELDEREAQAVEHTIAQHAEARLFVEQVRATAGVLRDELSRETAPQLTASQYAAIQRANEVALPQPLRLWVPIALAASMAIGLTAWMFWPPNDYSVTTVALHDGLNKNESPTPPPLGTADPNAGRAELGAVANPTPLARESLADADVEGTKAFFASGPSPKQQVNALPLELPNPAFAGTPKKIPAGVKMKPPKDREAYMLPAPIVREIKNLAAGRTVTSSDSAPLIGTLDLVTDGDKEPLDGRWVELAPGKQWVQIDLGQAHELFAVVIWHYHLEPRVYRDIVVQVSNDPEFKQGVVTIHNNDFDNTSGFGVGEEYEYFESYEGLLIPSHDTNYIGTMARYVRCYSKGSTSDDANHYGEVEVWGRPLVVQPELLLARLDETKRVEKALGLEKDKTASNAAPAEPRSVAASAKPTPERATSERGKGAKDDGKLGAGKPAERSKSEADAKTDEAVKEQAPLPLALPNPAFAGTPKKIPAGTKIAPSDSSALYSIAPQQADQPDQLGRRYHRELAESELYDDYAVGGLVAGAPADTRYEIKEGDTLRGIAQQQLGDGEKWYYLERANNGVIVEGKPLQPGTIIVIPDFRRRLPPNFNTEQYDAIVENSFLRVVDQPLSTFSIDVDTASMSNTRRFISMGQLPPRGAVRIEELVNYFPYYYGKPEGDHPFTANIEVAGCPWNGEHRLVRVGLQAKPIENKERAPSNLVFLVDVSGSMNEPAKLPLVKQSLRMLANELGENDRVAMVVYAGASGLVLESTPCHRKQEVLDAIDRLQAGGSTNGGAGIELAYKIAAANFIKNGTNRVILATDGDFNVGVTDRSSLVKLIEEKRKTGVFLSVLGYGTGNLKDSQMEDLSAKGNGNYAYIDSLREARKVLVEQMGGTLVTVAKDVKIQVEFNPSQVASYRLIGYENRMLAKEDFNDDRKDAGEIGAGHTVTALYEVVPAGKTIEGVSPKVDDLKYQRALSAKPQAALTNESKELLTLKLRYKKPDGDVSTKLEFPITDDGRDYARASGDFKFASAVAAYGMILRDSQYKGVARLDAVLELASEGVGEDKGGHRTEFLDMVRKTKQVAPEK